MDVFSGISAVVTLLASVGTLTKRLHDAKSKYNDVGLYTATVTSQLSLIRAALDQIKEWRARVSSDSESSKQLDEDLDTSLKCCAILIAVITTKLGECDAEPGMKERINYIWHEDILKEYVSNLDGQIRALQLLLTIFQCKSTTERNRKLELEENRSIIQQIRSETESLKLDYRKSQYAISILSNPSVDKDFDSIILRSRPYKEVYGNRRPRRPQPQRYNSMLLDVPPDSNHGEEMSSSCVRIVDNEKDNDHVNPKNDAAHISQQSQQSPDVRLPPSNESIHQLPLFGLSQVNFAPISGLAPEMPPPGSVFASSSTEENSPGLKRCSTNLVDNRESQADENPATPVQHITSTGIVSHSSPLNIHTYVSSSDFDPTKLSRAPQEHKCTHKSSKLDLHLQSSPPPPTRTPPSTPEIFHHKPFFPSECLSDDQTPMQGDKLSCHVGKRPKIPKLNIPIEADGMKEPLAHSPILVSNIIPESTHMPIKLIDYENSYQSLNTQNLGITMGCIRPQPTDLAQHESLPSANRPQNFLNLKGGESELRDTVRRKYFIRMPSLPRLSTRKKSSKILAIFYAAETGNAEALKQLLETTSDANSRNQQSRTPQMQAAMYGRLNCLQILKDHNANELAVDQDGRTVMHIATLMNQTGVVTWLLKTYSVPTHDAPRQSSRLARISGNIIGRPSLRLHETSDMEGYKALHLAVKANLERMVRLLVEFGLEINSRTNLGRTPLHEAVILNNKDISALLITNGADIHIADSNTMSPLHWAAVLGHRESVALLLANNADKSRYDGDGDLPIHKAAWSRHLALFDEFVGERADLELKTRTGESLLHIACLRDDLELAQYLLRHDVNANSWAAPNHPRTSNVHNIALQRRNPPSRPKAFSRTPLHCSCMHGHFAMVSLLLDHGAQANAALENGMTPLMMAVENEDADLVSLLLAHNANVNAADRVRRTALHIACARGDLKTVRELIRHGADVNAKSRDRLRPLEYAIVVVGYDPVFFDRLTLIIDYFVTLDQKNLKIANNFLRSRSSSSF